MQMEFKEVVEFVFEIGLTLILRIESCCLISSFRWNLIFISRLDDIECSFNIFYGNLKLIYDSNVFSNQLLCNELYKLKICPISTLNVENGSIQLKKILCDWIIFLKKNFPLILN